MRKAPQAAQSMDERERIAWDSTASLGLAALHLACVSVFWLECSWVALVTCFVCYVLRMFGLSAGFHRYFAHRTYRTGRIRQCLLACLGTAAAQRGPLWWTAHHRQHHRYADTAWDIHSPVVRTLWWAHLGWVLCRKYDMIDPHLVRDWESYPELRWLDRHFLVPPTALAVTLVLIGLLLERYAPGLHTSGLQLLVYGFVLSTVLLYHGTFTVNSLAHLYGCRRFATQDHSRNNWLVALITLGEGWHNNHHYYPASERQGFYWWELDMTHSIITVLAWCRLVWAVRTPPARLYQRDPPLSRVLRSGVRAQSLGSGHA